MPNWILKVPGRLHWLGLAVEEYLADIVALQEVFSKKAHYLGSLDAYPYRAWGTPKGTLKTSSGLLTLSKWPIVRSHVLEFSRASGTDWFARKGALFTRIQTPSGLCIDIVNTHLNAVGDEEIRWHQLQEILLFVERIRALDPIKPPLALMGDLNFCPNGMLWKRLQQDFRWKDCHQGADGAATYDASRNPLAEPRVLQGKLDYIFTEEGSHRCAILDAGLVFDHPYRRVFLSDHFGVQARLAILPAA